jgi:hypothetical protein
MELQLYGCTSTKLQLLDRGTVAQTDGDIDGILDCWQETEMPYEYDRPRRMLACG